FCLGVETFFGFPPQAPGLPTSLRPAFLPLALTGAYLGRIERLGAAALKSVPRLPLWLRHWLMLRRAMRGW
ncbi:MAG: phytoene/squalene synthase family protein, partial [Proteobacteria bacterium]